MFPSQAALPLAATAALSLLLTALTILACRRFGIVADRANSVQSVHRHWAPRMGGLPVFLSLLAGCLWLLPDSERGFALLLLLCSLPAFVAGFIEDLWDRVGPRARLIATFVAAWCAWFLLDGELRSVALPGFDWLLQNWTWFAFLFTAFAVGGVAHSVNIIDGFNGLSGTFCAICFAAYYLVAGQVGDTLVQALALLYLGALVGFLVFNFPYGRIFLGDAGAYFLGFSLGELSVLLVARNPEVSPWFCFLVMAYPIWDTLFSSWRREVVRGVRWSAADALHLHHLIYRRLVRSVEREVWRSTHSEVLANSITSVYLWGLALLSAVPAVLFWNNTPLLLALSALFCLTYGLLYRRLVTFRAPTSLLLPSRRKSAHLRRRHRELHGPGSHRRRR